MLAGASFDELVASYDLDDGERWLTNYYFLSAVSVEVAVVLRDELVVKGDESVDVLAASMP